MALIDIEAFGQAAKKDPEFTRETRYLNGAIKLVAADEEYVLEFANGQLKKAAPGSLPDASCKIFIKGTRDHWTKMLAKYPPPFHQSLQSTAVKHGLKISDTNEAFAYLPALNRMMQLLRGIHNKG